MARDVGARTTDERQVVGRDAVTLRVAAKGTLFIGRQAGARLRRWLEAETLGQPDDVVWLNLGSVTAFDHPAADEAFAKFLLALRSGVAEPRCVVFTNVGEAQIEHLHAVLDRRSICALASDRRGLRLIGHVPPGIADVFDHTLKLGAVSAARLGELLGITTNAASNRLRLLWIAGILRRREVFEKLGGRKYEYTLPVRLSARRSGTRARAS